MNDDDILEVDGVYKLYARKQSRARARLRSTLVSAFMGRQPVIDELQPDEMWAVKNVSFSLKRGSALGIIGLNGSGKTTLLRMIAGQLLPDRGEIRVNGRSASVIALSAGLQKQLSGRKNIYLRSAMLGRSKEETEAVVNEIIEFTELGEAIDAPVATYSSGMTVRLAFAVTVFVDPDLLVVDETLSVGDFKFKQKCLEQVRKLRERTSFILVSHSMGDIMRFCDEVILLRKGEVIYKGDPQTAIELYTERESQNEPYAKAGKRVDASALLTVAMGQYIHNETAIRDVVHEWVGSNGEPASECAHGDTLTLRVSFDITHTPRKLIIGIPVWNEEGQFITGFSTELTGIEGYVARQGRQTLELRAPSIPFNAGKCYGVIAITDGPETLYRQPLPVLQITDQLPYSWGSVTLPHQWSVVQDAEDNASLSEDATEEPLNLNSVGASR